MVDAPISFIRSLRKHPQLLVVPFFNFEPTTIVSFPHEHLHLYFSRSSSLTVPITVNRPNSVPIGTELPHDLEHALNELDLLEK